MIRFILVRLLQLIPVGFGITLVVFFLLRLVPGDPAAVALGPYVTPEEIATLRDKWGLDQPLLVQYATFLSGAAHGDLGYSYFYAKPASELIGERLIPTLFLISYTVVLTIVISVPAGVIAAIRRDSIADNLVRGFIAVGLGLPAYWIGIVLLLALGIWIPLFPVGGYGQTPFEQVRSLFLPALTITLGLAPLVIRALRASVIETLQADHVDMARSKGLPNSVLLSRHIVRPALIPAVTVLGVNVGLLVGSTLIIESVFAVPGLGQLMITAVSTRDYPTVQAVTLIFAVLVVLVNLATDVAVALLDPRARASLGA